MLSERVESYAEGSDNRYDKDVHSAIFLSDVHIGLKDDKSIQESINELKELLKNKPDSE